MGKPRSKVSAAEVVARKKKKAKRSDLSSNPFEVRVNRRKHDVLGQKIRSGRGLPGVARSRAVQKVTRRSPRPLPHSLPVSSSTEETDSAAGVPLSGKGGRLSGQAVR